MKYLQKLSLLTLFLMSLSQVQAQKTWEGYYLEFRFHDPALQITFPHPNERMKTYQELKPRERRLVKRHLKSHYGVRPNFSGYIVGTFKTVSGSVLRTIIYIATLGATAIIINAILTK
jgi:hypothetical protein